jgi:hypothetical protein
VNTQPAVDCAHSKASIKVCFAPDPPIYLQIKPRVKTSPQNNSIHPALFQITARIEVPSLPCILKTAPDSVISKPDAEKLPPPKKSKIGGHPKASS